MDIRAGHATTRSARYALGPGADLPIARIVALLLVLLPIGAWFIASNVAAMPPELLKNARRLMPSLSLAVAASSSIRASTRRCCSVCGTGMYSPFEIIRVGIGERTDSATSARSHCATCSASNSP